MIRVDVDLKGLDQRLSSERLRKHVYNRVKAKTKQLKAEAQKAAPKDRGALAMAIYARTYKNPLRTTIGIFDTLRGDSGFKYAEFVAGGLTINPGPRNPFFQGGQKVVYGEPALTPSGNLVAWKQDGMWWERVRSKARRSYPQTVARAIKDFTKEVNG